MTPPSQGVTPKVQPNTCLELALEGERLCKSGDFPAGVAFLEVSEANLARHEESNEFFHHTRVGLAERTNSLT